MGLDIHCVCGEIHFRAGAYDYFALWRTILAKIGGVDLYKMRGFNGFRQWTGNERFYELLCHSDCEGVLIPSECKNLLKDFKWLEKRLASRDSTEEIYQNIFNPLPEIDEFWKKRFQLWKKAFEHSVKHNCKLIFG